jgi:hypothetical protein
MLSLLRKAIPFLAIVVVALAIYDGRIFYIRWRSARDAEQATRAMQLQQARQTIAMLGGGALKILDFYATPAAIRSGEHANICYGVYGAKSLRIEPPIEDLHLAVSHCLQVSPSVTTEYTLVAEDATGNMATQKFTLHVAR